MQQSESKNFVVIKSFVLFGVYSHYKEKSRLQVISRKYLVNSCTSSFFISSSNFDVLMFLP